MFDTLEKIVDDSQYCIFNHVPIKRFVDVIPETPGKFSPYVTIARASVNFVLFTRAAIKPVLAVQMGSIALMPDDQHVSDTMLDRIMAKAGLPILHVTEQASYDPETLAEDIKKAMTVSAPNHDVVLDI